MELQKAMVKTNHSIMASLLPMFVQAPVFISFFLSLRAMANFPVDGMRTEGLFWFQDLTLADPYYILPLVTSATLFGVLKLGVEYGEWRGRAAGGRRPDELRWQGARRRRKAWAHKSQALRSRPS